MALVSSTISEYGIGAMEVVPMYSDAEDELNVKVSNHINIEELTKDDEDPMFVNVEILRNGISDGNNRKYSADVVMNLASYIPGTLGYLGHPDPDKVSFAFREPHCIYVGSKVIQDEYGDTVRLIGKAYIFKTSQLREWIPKSIACGNPLTVSIHGKGDVSVDKINKIIHVHQITKLECIDWANPGTQGMSGSKALSVVSEMQGGENMDKIEVIQGVTLAEMQEHNAQLINEAVATIVSTMTISELQNLNGALVTEIEQKATISEMKLEFEGKEAVVALGDVQGIITQKETKISELQCEIESMKIDTIKTQLISEMVDEIHRDRVSARVTGKTEEELRASISSENQYISEIAGLGHDNPPRGAQPRQEEIVKQAVVNLFAGKRQ